MRKTCIECGVEFDAERSLMRCQTHRSITPRGYRRIKVNGRMVMEHRVVMERKLGRPLRSEEVVHHVSGDKLDNRPENLELDPSQAVHLRHHQQPATRPCKQCGRTFQAKPTEQKSFCSATCRRLYQRGRWICLGCGKVIEDYRHEPRKFCSPRCRANVQRGLPLRGLVGLAAVAAPTL